MDLDHLVIGAKDLVSGRQALSDLLGIDIPMGGKHDAMGTHNAVAAFDDQTYFEVIAIDPDGSAPETARWFGLDDPAVQALLEDGPRLLTWVARTDDWDETDPEIAGDVRPMQRGALSWEFGFRPEASRLEDGLIPNVIRWQSAPHPAGGMTRCGWDLDCLELHQADPVMMTDADSVDCLLADQNLLIARLTRRTESGGDVLELRSDRPLQDCKVSAAP